MITLTRRQARRLRGVFRRSVLGIGTRGPIPPLIVHAGGAQLRAHHRYAALAVEHAEPAEPQPAESIAVPLDALAEFEGRDESPVVIEAIAPDRTVVRFTDHGVPQSREFAVPPLDRLASFPEPPATWQSCSPELLAALAEATATGTETNTRYALDCIQLRARSSAHEVIATDGCQLLIDRRLQFSWEGDVLVRRSPVFACRALPRDRPLSLGKTETHVVLRIGPWTLFLEIQAEARFPEVASVLPDARDAATHLRLDPEDARFLGPALDRLPGADELNAPATVDLNGLVVVRARSADQGGVTELVLTRSGSVGTLVRFHANRAFLARALGLGFTELAVTDAGSPVVCRDDRRTYAWQPLNQESAIGPTEDMTRIESAPTNSRPAERPAATPKANSAMSERIPRTGPTDAVPGPNGVHHAPGAVPAGPGLAALIQEAEALHETLGTAKTRAQGLVVALRRQRKQARLMSGAIEALKQLRLQDVAAE